MTPHQRYLASVYDVADRDVVDIGAGNGVFAASLAVLGARVTGVEIEAEKIAQANTRYQGRFKMREGRGEALPLDDGSQDLACFMFSFHHVPPDVQDEALRETHRVLRRGGRLHVVDPRPFGTMFDVVRLVDDETDVRTRSQARLDALNADHGFEPVVTEEYVLERVFRDFEALKQHVVFVDPERSARFRDVEVAIKATFDRLSEAVPDGFRLHQPCVAYHFERV